MKNAKPRVLVLLNLVSTKKKMIPTDRGDRVSKGSQYNVSNIPMTEFLDLNIKTLLSLSEKLLTLPAIVFNNEADVYIVNQHLTSTMEFIDC